MVTLRLMPIGEEAGESLEDIFHEIEVAVNELPEGPLPAVLRATQVIVRHMDQGGYATEYEVF